MGSSNDSLTPPPLLPPPPMATIAVKNSGSSGTSYNPSLLIIAGLLAFVCLASTSIHLLLRFLSRASSPSSPLINRNVSSGSNATSTSSSASEKDPKSLIDSLPLFSLASSLTTLPKSSHNCAVCLSRFNPHDELRLLPACRHAFHSPCIDTWLRTTPSCPLCRSSIDLPPATESDSFRVEIGSISRRRAPEQTPAPSPTPPETQSYSVGSSFEYRMEDEVEAVVARVRRRVEEDVATRTSTGPLPPGAAVAEAAGEGGKSWLKEYVDRLASSASSSFSSLRFSSRQFDGGDERSWDMDGDAGSGEGSRSTSYRWLTGAVEEISHPRHMDSITIGRQVAADSYNPLFP